MKTLQQWLDWANTLDAIYLEELGRSCFSDREAFVNWTFHWAGGQTPEWVRARIREHPEWQQRHAQSPTPAPSISTPLPSGGNRIIRVTNDGDTFHQRFYSYWSNAWIHDFRTVIVFAGSQAEGRAVFFEVDIQTGEVDPLIGVDGRMAKYPGTTEGWSWDSQGWICFAHGPKIIRRNPFTGDEYAMLDISQDRPGCRLWQTHCTDDGKVRCGTVERITDSGPYERIETVVGFDGEMTFYPAVGTLDESQVTNEFLVIKETINGRLDNRIITLATGEERRLTDADGAVGHSDCEGHWLVGEDDQGGACVRWDLHTLQKTRLWDTWRMGHVSLRGGRILHSDDAHIAVRDFLGNVQSFIDHGAIELDYDSQVRANWDPTGRVACYMVDKQVYLYVP